MSVLSSYRLMNRYRHLRRVSLKYALQRCFVHGMALILIIIILPVTLTGNVMRNIGELLTDLSDSYVNFIENLYKPVQRRMERFTENANRAMHRQDKEL